MKPFVFVAALVLASAPLVASASQTSSCVDTSEVVGERHCSRFGDRWSSERLFRIVLGAGFWTGHTTATSRRWNASFGKENPIKFGIPARALGISTIDDVGFDFRIHGYASRHVYLGFDWALAFGSVRTTFEQPSQTVELGNAPGLNFIHAKLGGVVGTRIPLGPLSARLESVIGLEIASISANGRRWGQSEWTRGSISSVNLLLEPRVGVDVWTSPWSTITAWGGINMVYPSERSMGVSFALHGRAFDGAR